MLEQDRNKLKELFSNYSPQELISELSDVALETASELSDDGLKERAQDLVKFSVSLEDLISGRPFLV